jgi:hypothetical protein
MPDWLSSSFCGTVSAFGDRPASSTPRRASADYNSSRQLLPNVGLDWHEATGMHRGCVGSRIELEVVIKIS